MKRKIKVLTYIGGEGKLLKKKDRLFTLKAWSMPPKWKPSPEKTGKDKFKTRWIAALTKDQCTEEATNQQIMASRLIYELLSTTHTHTNHHVTINSLLYSLESIAITLRKLTMSLSMTTRGLSIKWTTPLRTGMLAFTMWVTTKPRGWW